MYRANEMNCRIFSILGTVEAPSSIYLGRFTCKARENIEQTILLQLPGSSVDNAKEGLEIQVVYPEENRTVLSRCTTIQIGPYTQISDGAWAPTLFLDFAPLRPIRALVQVLVTNHLGGRWRFRMDLNADASEADDTIHLVSTLNKTSSVSFHLTNRTAEDAIFTSLVLPETQKTFKVSPMQGILHPYGSDGTRFKVDFTPAEYGKAYRADLIIDTDEMQWIYHLEGSFPAYEAPTTFDTASRVDSHISEHVDQRYDNIHKYIYTYTCGHI